MPSRIKGKRHVTISEPTTHTMVLLDDFILTLVRVDDHLVSAPTRQFKDSRKRLQCKKRSETGICIWNRFTAQIIHSISCYRISATLRLLVFGELSLAIACWVGNLDRLIPTALAHSCQPPCNRWWASATRIGSGFKRYLTRPS